MEKERIRKALLGALRFGKPVVFDMEDANLFDQIQTFIDNVHPGLYQSALDGSITKRGFNINKIISKSNNKKTPYGLPYILYDIRFLPKIALTVIFIYNMSLYQDKSCVKSQIILYRGNYRKTDPRWR